MMAAALIGKVAEVQELIAAKADKTLRNQQGLTALDITRDNFGGVVPRVLQHLLDETEIPEISLIEPFEESQ